MLYAETSAVLAWLRGEDTAVAVTRALRTADAVVTSELTLLELERVLERARTTDLLPERDVLRAMDRVRRTSRYWLVVRLHAAVLQRAGRAFPVEPVRTLDALHLSTALEIGRAGPPVSMLSLDRRIRENAVALGFEVRPE